MFVIFYCVLFFFKQKTAYEMRISDWSSDVCSSDLVDGHFHMAARQLAPRRAGRAVRIGDGDDRAGAEPQENPARQGRRRLEICTVEIGRASCRERVCQYV